MYFPEAEVSVDGDVDVGVQIARSPDVPRTVALQQVDLAVAMMRGMDSSGIFPPSASSMSCMAANRPVVFQVDFMMTCRKCSSTARP